MEESHVCEFSTDGEGCEGEVRFHKLSPTKKGEVEEYLCDEHFALARDIHDDPMRVRHVLAYLERTRNGIEICSACSKELKQTGSREQRYCSNACKQRAYRWRQVAT